MQQHHLALAISTAFTVITTILVGISIGATLAGDSWRVLLFCASGASAAAIIAALLWVALWVVRTRESDDDRGRAAIDADRNLLIRTLDGVAAPAQSLRRTLPLPRPLPYRRAL